MAPKIYQSQEPVVPVVERSIVTHLFTKLDLCPRNTPAFVDAQTGTTVTRGALNDLVLSFGYGLRRRLNAKRGETLMVFSPNCLAFPIVVLGSISAGLRVTLANSTYTPHELAFQYTDSRAGLIVTTPDGLPIVREMFSQLNTNGEDRIILITNGFGWAGGPDAEVPSELSKFTKIGDLIKLGKLEEEEKFTGKDARETVFLCYSSGTTGKPKGVETTHRNLTSVLDMVGAVFPATVSGVDTMLGILPFYHIYGAVKLLLFPFYRGMPCIIQPRFDPEQFCANIEKYKISISLVVPPVLVVLARHPAVEKYNLNSLRVLISGAAPLGESLSQQVSERFRKVRTNKQPVAIIQGYGLTETSPTTHLTRESDAFRKQGSIGVLLSNLQARIVSEDGNDTLEGELWVKGPSVMKGYLNNPTATKNSITEDGWFQTGDIAKIDEDGYYYIVDRKKELIKYKGFQVPPAELESVLLTHPSIADSAVIGVYNEKEATEVPRACVVHAQPDKIKSNAEKEAFKKDVVQFIAKKVARHKHLRGGVMIIDAVPKSAAGKILRRQLRDLVTKESQQHTKARL